MRKAMLMLVATFGVVALSLSATAQMVDGEVKKVDASAGKITNKRGPIKKFDMQEGHTMVFRAADPAMLKPVKPGDKIRFETDKVSGQFAVMTIERLGRGGRQEKPLPSKPARHTTDRAPDLLGCQRHIETPHAILCCGPRCTPRLVGTSSRCARNAMMPSLLHA